MASTHAPGPDDLDFGATLRGFSAGMKMFGRFRLIELLGRGGMGVVWRAHDEKLERDVALKFLPEVITLDADAVADLRRETRRCLDLTHVNIVRVYDFLHDGNLAALSMEVVVGRSLVALKQERPDRVFSPSAVEPYLRQILSALDYAHGEAKVVHRDLKPANIMVTVEGRVKILDFGIAASISESASRVSNRGTSGTLTYMSPQQLLGKNPTAADDWYALGATLYDLLTSKPPFTRGDLTHLILNTPPDSLAARREELGIASAEPIPATWETVVAALLAKKPVTRPQSGAAVLALLDGKKVGPEHFAALPAQESANYLDRLNTTSESKPVSRKPLWFGATVVGLIAIGAVALQKINAGKVPHEPAVLAESSVGKVQPKVATDRQIISAAPENNQLAKIETAKLISVPLAKEVDIERTEAKSAKVTNGGLRIMATPENAEVSIDGGWIGKVPVDKNDLKAGTHRLRIEATNYEPWEGEVNVLAGEMTALPKRQLRALLGSLQINSDPIGANVIVNAADGRTVGAGKTPLELNGMVVGNYRVSFEQIGWDKGVKEVVVEREQKNLVRYDFPQGTIDIKLKPLGAEVELVGPAGKMLKATSPYVFSGLIPGAYKIKATAAKRALFEKELVVIGGASAAFDQELDDSDEVKTRRFLNGVFVGPPHGPFRVRARMRFTDADQFEFKWNWGYGYTVNRDCSIITIGTEGKVSAKIMKKNVELNLTDAGILWEGELYRKGTPDDW